MRAQATARGEARFFAARSINTPHHTVNEKGGEARHCRHETATFAHPSGMEIPKRGSTSEDYRSYLSGRSGRRRWRIGFKLRLCALPLSAAELVFQRIAPIRRRWMSLSRGAGVPNVRGGLVVVKVETEFVKDAEFVLRVGIAVLGTLTQDVEVGRGRVCGFGSEDHQKNSEEQVSHAVR